MSKYQKSLKQNRHRQRQQQKQGSKQKQRQKQKQKDKQRQKDREREKQNKYNYLQHSFQKQLQRSYDRNNGINNFSPPSVNFNFQNNNPGDSSSNCKSPSNHKDNRAGWPNRQRSAPRQSQFSPYQNKQQNVRDKILVQELKNHNRVLTQQLNQYKNMVDKLHVQLRIRSDQFANIDLLRQKQKAIHDQTVAQMKQEIGILLTKNTFLQQRSIVLERQLKKYQTQILKNQARTRSLSAVAVSSKQVSSKLIHQITSILNTFTNKPIKKRDNGKLMNQTFSNVNSALQSPKTSTKSSNFSQTYVIQQIQSIARRVQKYQQLIQSVLQMHQKITGRKIAAHQSTERQTPNELKLKAIWKWLKQLGHNYNITQKWKKMLMEVLGLTRSYKFEDITIDQVLEKTVVELHSK